MKKKIYSLILLLFLVFTTGCNKEKEQPAPTPTATTAPTATPTPENLAKTNLNKLPEIFNSLMSYHPESNIDYSKGVGYDVTVNLSIGQQIVDLLELSGLDNVHASGTIDIKDALAANMTLYLNDSEIVNAHVFADDTSLLYNLPRYSTNYAAISWQELLNSLQGEPGTEESVFDYPLSDSGNEVIHTLNTVDRIKFPSAEGLQKLFCTYIKDFTDCFLEEPGITKNASIGTGDYLLTGEKHTVRASLDELYAVLEGLEAELKNYNDITFDEEDYKIEGAASLILDYYISENGDFAWALYPDNGAEEPLVYISTASGFCLYRTQEDGSAKVAMYSVKTSENSGIITLPDSDTAPVGTINYELGENSFSLHAFLDTSEFSLEVSKINDTIRYNTTVVVGGISFVAKETLTPGHADVSCTVASYGMEYLTLSASTDIRDYVEIPFPQNTVSAETWSEELNQDTLLADLIQLMQDYPFLMNLIGGSWDDSTGDISEEDPFVAPKDYKDEFSSMTGYTIDSSGYVDFIPEESEVLALGKPSSGLDTMKITDDQTKALMDYAKKAFKACSASDDTNYWVWGSVEYGDVQSYYTKTYSFYEADNSDNGIILEFDAVSGEFSSAEIYNKDKSTALRMANEILALLGINYTVTAEIAESYAFTNNLSFSGYDASLYGGNYYCVGFSVYYPEW